jgi:hypothetical protein
MQVWIVSFTTVEYSDREMFIDRCFIDYDAAVQYTEEKNVDVQVAIDAKEPVIGESSRRAEYPFNGQAYDVRSYYGYRANPFTVSGPYEVKE